MKYLVFDVETTGLPKKYTLTPTTFQDWPHIVQIAWIIGKKEKMYYVKPEGYSIPESSVKIHGISNKMALKNGLPIEYILKIFKEDCEKVDYLVAHNATFDKNMVLAACYRHNKDTRFLLDKKILCTMKSNVERCKLPGKYGYKYPKLEELYKFLFKKKPNVKLHDALEDCKLTMLCHEKIKCLKN